MRDGAVAEEVHGVIWWQFKSIVIASQTKSVKDSGLSPYVYQKASRAADVWKGTELLQVMDRLMLMYHQAHRGEIDFATELEKFVLFPMK
jgi:hypothetical protein